MLAYLLRRLALMVPVAFLVSLAVFSLIHLTPVDPAELILGEEHSPQAVAALRHELGLDRPLPSSTSHGSATRCVATSAVRCGPTNPSYRRSPSACRPPSSLGLPGSPGRSGWGS